MKTLFKKEPPDLLLRRKRAEELRQEMEALEEEMKRTDALFNLAADEDLVDSFIYERSAQVARMNYLLRLAKDTCGAGSQ
ncbi:MAG TPA: DUF2508 family protein [Oscillospiraceae bacterium]|nr:DUF2508 family protein [Oscillospiraceae bacterium]